MKNSILHITLLLLLAASLQAQDSTTHVKKQKALLLGLGSSHYRGDLGDGYAGGRMLVAVGLELNRNKRLNGNFVLNFGSIQGNELDYQYDDGSGSPTTPNETFSTNYFSFNFEVHYNLIHKENWRVYVSQGIGLMRYVPKDEDLNELMDQTDTRALNETYRNLTFILPTQIGFKYYLNNGYGVGMQGGFTNTLTDYLDNISAWGNKKGNDNILTIRVQLSIPIPL
ncbi:outer membrane beta-barrel protein [Reichenbachiella agarivorans]|uniref:Outer membrane beta-barrel protein n=1 Tax=Reichenbachiella agarivorans TaxID=2979464 RepID=A0ABY6CMM8_9BACT|nr:outer membrane beta-barrel protein [Reichenbachiella agarivorans]UXP30613.1 outer membrane beta-barrel protein [Reichenbachiella agarivorans]